MNLAELHLLNVVEVARGMKDGEQGRPVSLQLGPMMGRNAWISTDKREPPLGAC
jgi:hypothetical protein